jgi:hypothetical protein
LVGRFGEHAVFMDVAAIAPGRDFRKAIDESVAACGALLAVVGPTWSSIANDRGMRRLDDPADFVRLEIANALKRDIPVIPVLVRGAKMPRIEELPDDLKELVYRNAVEVSHARWRMDVGVLADALRDLPGIAREPDPAAAVAVAATPMAPVRAAEAVAQQPVLAPEALRGVAHELARYIGPIADVVVKHAARRSATIADLYDAVAREIEKPTDREAFLALKPRST